MTPHSCKPTVMTGHTSMAANDSATLISIKETYAHHP
ncbi:hypothetical protein CO2235_MP10342 [Cupriavidus oxalaticus]|uniref:Uncharacterized protein n=1 Tax=Cupriavidus oxalaticus TaxID=96344 RepID=A0A976BGG3_9BURK|nr:hypothetical protein CO2235_MP10342 [Cupriavidus oxalaticus]